ncbi:hypothetical protein THAOC_27652 [Thalassiosira oceanica]|uniref:Uncharacterized protein n=1 Tax=Thalassiosira oceanica TaxID=159749 RepID=K0RVW4_THAOC|nr:hypothetical protein THAOC_27652 [Thalassiosira oceanica]|eukprot:EJK52991.1 hypothetical protein THAOC_27652 [Thalassiosira oceanica]
MFWQSNNSHRQITVAHALTGIKKGIVFCRFDLLKIATYLPVNSMGIQHIRVELETPPMTSNQRLDNIGRSNRLGAYALSPSIVRSVPVAENAPVEIHKPSWRERRETSAERAKKKAELEKTHDFSLDQTQPIAVKDGLVTFTMHFKYLGSFISYNLRDDFDIDLRIKKAGQAGALKHFFNNKQVDVKQRQRPPMQLSPEDTKQPTDLDLEL